MKNKEDIKEQIKEMLDKAIDDALINYERGTHDYVEDIYNLINNLIKVRDKNIAERAKLYACDPADMYIECISILSLNEIIQNLDQYMNKK
jgi:hypothetical protein